MGTAVTAVVVVIVFVVSVFETAVRVCKMAGKHDAGSGDACLVSNWCLTVSQPLRSPYGDCGDGER